MLKLMGVDNIRSVLVFKNALQLPVWLLMLTCTGYKVLGTRYKNSLRLGLVWVEDAAVAVSPEGSLPVDSWCPGAGGRPLLSFVLFLY